MVDKRTGDEPAIYVGDYASYNNGSLAGRWMTLDGKTAEEIEAEIAQIMKDNEKANGGRWICEEPMIQDYENLPSEIYAECGMDYACIAQYLALGEHERVQVEAYLEWSPYIENALANYEVVRLAESRDDFIDEEIELMEVPDRLINYIDREAVERDMNISGCFVTLDMDGSCAYVPEH